MPSTATKRTSCAEQPVCVAVNYPKCECEDTTRKKKSSAVPLFHAYAVYHLHPSPLKERQEFKEEGKPWVSLPFCPRAGRRNVSLYHGATPRSDRRTACAFRAHRTAGVDKYSPRGNVSLRGSRASDSACRCSRNFRLKTPQKVLYYNHYTKENRNL